MEFDRLYADYADTVYSYLRFKLKDAYLVEDIVQETFLSVYSNLRKAAQAESVKAWILTIAHHKMVDRLRRSPPDTLREPENLALTVPSYEKHIAMQLDLEQIVNRLDDVSRQIIYGIYVENLTYKEMAQILGIPEGTVKSKCHYARNKLKDWYKEESGNYGIHR